MRLLASLCCVLALGCGEPTPEKGAVGQQETVNFLVSGMDCTSCADKLMRVFSGMTGVSDPRVNFVMGNGEITVDTSITDAKEVLRFASTASGFHMVKVIGGSYFIDILSSPSQIKRLAETTMSSQERLGDIRQVGIAYAKRYT